MVNKFAGFGLNHPKGSIAGFLILEIGQMADYITPPWNFSWVIKGKISGCGWPNSYPNIEYLRNEGVRHIVSLSEELLPPESIVENDTMKYHIIPVQEFEPPTIKQIEDFISICDKANTEKKAVCVHCRQGNGRTGVMLACYLVKFCKQIPDQALCNIRLMRPYSVETYEQERIIKEYYDHLARNR